MTVVTTTAAALTEREMTDRFYARDRESNGRFLTAVLSTGIYCLPSCPARKPLRENLRFFQDAAHAVRAGFRACLRCRPDEWKEGLDADVERVGRIVDAVERDASSFVRVDSLANLAGVQRSRLGELFRLHLHQTPASWLRARRIEAAARLIATSSRAISDIALDHQFESSSSFHTAFTRLLGVTPAELRVKSRSIGFRLPAGFRNDLFLESIGADPLHPSERSDGSSFRIVARSHGDPFVLNGTFRERELQVSYEGAKRLTTFEVVRYVARRLRLGSDPADFERAADADFRSIIGAASGLRLAILSSPFDTLVWAVVGQAISRASAAKIRRLLTDLAAPERFGDLMAPPTARQIARLDEKRLLGCGLTRTKSRTVLAVSGAVASGSLDLDTPRSVEEIRHRLLPISGIGRWTTEYVLLRGYGFGDVVPLGDAALRAAVSRWKYRGRAVTDDEISSSLDFCSGNRSLAVEHLWQWNDRQSRNDDG